MRAGHGVQWRKLQGADMAKALGVLFLLALVGCTSVPQVQLAAHPCDAGEASYACQVARYERASGP
jgi:hypothetical protein